MGRKQRRQAAVAPRPEFVSGPLDDDGGDHSLWQSALGIAFQASKLDDPLDALRGLSFLRDSLEQLAAQLVGRARAGGTTWEQIAVALDLRRQTVWERYGRPTAPWFPVARDAEDRARGIDHGPSHWGRATARDEWERRPGRGPNSGLPVVDEDGSPGPFKA